MGAVHKLEVFERRRAPRYEAWKSGIVHTRRGSSQTCIVEDVSETGALLRLVSAAALPKTLILEVPEDGIELDCTVIRKDGRHIGVEFLSRPRKTQAFAELAD